MSNSEDNIVKYLGMFSKIETKHQCYQLCTRNISIGVPLDLSTPTAMGYTEPLVENENSAKQQRNEKLCHYNLYKIFSGIYDKL